MFLCNLLIVSYKGTKNILFPQLFQSFSYTELTYYKQPDIQITLGPEYSNYYFSLRELRFIAPLQRSRQVTFMGQNEFCGHKSTTCLANPAL
jgi:hypothetical protein